MDINNQVKFIIELKTCEIHHKTPHVNITENKVQIMCCCVEFKIECLKSIIRLLNEHKKVQYH